MEPSISIITKEQLGQISSLYDDHKKELIAYADQLLWWNKKVNLVSRDVSRETLLEHVGHCLFVNLFLDAKDRSLVDAGSGGGLPGIPLAICVKELEQVVLNDIVTKKIFASNAMISSLKIGDRTKGVAGSIADVPTENDTVIVTKHAFKLDELYGFVGSKAWSKLIFLKGWRESLKEYEAIKEHVSMQVIKLDADFMGEFYDGKGIVMLERIK